MMKKIISLSKVFLLDYYQKLNLISKNKINKKSIFFWMILVLILSIGWLSYQAIDFLDKAGEPQIFLNIYLLILGIVLFIQTSMVCNNVFYYSKDLEYVLPLPIKPIELLLAKFNTVLGILYISEAIFAIIPLLIYGFIAANNIFYFFWMILSLIIFPIFPVSIIGILMFFIMKLSKFIKNKDIFQIIIVIFLVFVMTSLEGYVLKNLFNENQNTLKEINQKIIINNKYLLFIEPTVKMLSENNNFIAFFNLIKLLAINLIGIILFIFIGRITYLKNILKSVTYVSLKKEKKKKNKYKYKVDKKDKAYIKKEIKLLLKSPMYFMQCILPIIFILILIVVICGEIAPGLNSILEAEEISKEFGKMTFDFDSICIILIIIQILFTIPSISITAISREGKNAIFLKYIPISFYKQFVYKNIPQIIINTITIITVLAVINIYFYSINIVFNVLIFIIAMIINLINCYLMLLVDLKRPKLEWNTELSAVKQSQNKLFQYFFTIIMIIVIYLLSEVLKKINLNFSVIVLVILFSIVFIAIDRIIKIKENKLFNKIY